MADKLQGSQGVHIYHHRNVVARRLAQAAASTSRLNNSNLTVGAGATFMLLPSSLCVRFIREYLVYEGLRRARDFLG